MRNIIQAIFMLGVVVVLVGPARAQAPAGLGTQEFGLTPRQLVQSIEKVEELIAKCMREQGFQYIAADYNTVRRGMSADKNLPGVSEEEFINQYGLGVSTMYTGEPPQLAEGYSPAKVGLGEQNVQAYKNLSPADQVAYNRALFGENTDATFAVGLETENFSRCGGCTRAAIEQVFDPEQLRATYYNPLDALINKDQRMKAALRKYAAEMRKAGAILRALDALSLLNSEYFSGLHLDDDVGFRSVSGRYNLYNEPLGSELPLDGHCHDFSRHRFHGNFPCFFFGNG